MAQSPKSAPANSPDEARARAIAQVDKVDGQIRAHRMTIDTAQKSIDGLESFKRILAQEHGFKLDPATGKVVS